MFKNLTKRPVLLTQAQVDAWASAGYRLGLVDESLRVPVLIRWRPEEEKKETIFKVYQWASYPGESWTFQPCYQTRYKKSEVLAFSLSVFNDLITAEQRRWDSYEEQVALVSKLSHLWAQTR